MISEFSLIDKIRKQLPAYGKNVVVGIGDDAAVVKTSGNKLILATCDSQVEDVHFERTRITPKQLGQRAIAVALSDIAAMGGTPKHILISLVIPADSGQARMTFIEKLYEGFAKACKKYKVDIIGGNISRGPGLIIDIFVLGEIDKKNIIRRNGAKVGDVVLVTGRLGKSKIPIARIKEGQILAESGVVTSMIDVSDGLSTDLLHICEESGVGVRIFADKLPIGQSVSLNIALNGGEDYELCFTTEPKNAEQIIAEVHKKTGTAVTIIGEIIDKKEGWWMVDKNGKSKLLKAGGWDHFSKKVVRRK